MAYDPNSEIFTKDYWDRPAAIPRKGDESPDQLFKAVGAALSSWERADQALASLFLMFCDCSGSDWTEVAIQRAYGAIQSNSGRREAVMAAGEAFFNHWWKAARPDLLNIINSVQWASKRRDDIAHGIVSKITHNGIELGHFHHPPEYNSGRTNMMPSFTEDTVGIEKYRYTADNIRMYRDKFISLRLAIYDYADYVQAKIADSRKSTN